MSRRGRAAGALAVTLAAGAAVAIAKEPWSYEGATGPANWGTLSPDYALCADGSAQSPVDIQPGHEQALKNIGFSYPRRSKVKAVDNGHTIKWSFAGGSPAITIAGKRYALLQMHFHAPSEHRVNGQLHEAELHIVHRRADGVLAVVGFFVEKGARNAAWAPLIKALPHGDTRSAGRVGLRSLMPADPRTVRYAGSLTTPPCSEGVRWNVMTQPITMSAAQIAALRDAHNGNRRPVQELNGRTLTRDTSRRS